MDNLTSQREELLALQSIYEEKDFIVDEGDPPKGRYVANVSLPPEFYVVCNNSSSSDVIKCNVDYLPPLKLFFEFPKTYPSVSSPAFILLCNWLTLKQISQICEKLEDMWKNGQGEVVLFQWFSFLQEETLEFLGIHDMLDITELSHYKLHTKPKRSLNNSRNLEQKSESLNLSWKRNNRPRYANRAAKQLKLYHRKKSEKTVEISGAKCDKYDSSDFPQSSKFTTSKNEMRNCNLNFSPSVSRGNGQFDKRAILELMNGEILLVLLQEFNKRKKAEAFKHAQVTCRICFLEKPGSEFLTFNECDHAYCRECLKSYFEIQISDGNVYSLNCPEEKCTSQADGTQVKEIVSPDLFLRYDKLLLTRTLEGMSDITFCPRPACQLPVITEPNSTMGRCASCQYVFCLLCRTAYHGVAPCSLKDEQRKQICNQYLESSENEKCELEKRYGKKMIKVLVDNMLSENWVESNSKKCPHCHTNIEKIDGCNKMTCHRCDTYFCWLCMSRLSQTNPYDHFKQQNSTCFGRLFPEDEDDDFDDDDDIPGAFLEIYEI